MSLTNVMSSPRASSAMEEYPQISKALSEPDNLFLLSRKTVDGHLRTCLTCVFSCILLTLLSLDL